MIWAPDFDQQLSMCNDPVCVTNQNLKKFEFDARQVHFRSGHEQSSFVEINLDVARSKYRCLFGHDSGPAEGRPNASQELANCERLIDEIIGAGIQRR